MGLAVRDARVAQADRARGRATIAADSATFSPVQTTALIVVDMLNPYAHEDADLLAESVQARLERIVAVIEEAKRRDDVQLIYVNDNDDAWDAGRDELVERALAGARPDLVEPIVPTQPVPFLAKGRHSIFYETALDHVLRIGDIGRVVLVGQVTEQCILYSALDAYLRGYEVVVAPDGVAPIHDDLADAALRMMQRNMHVDLVPVDAALQPGLP
jgi:nicotinamidase-related amidase